MEQEENTTENPRRNENSRQTTRLEIQLQKMVRIRITHLLSGMINLIIITWFHSLKRLVKRRKSQLETIESL